MVKALIHFSTPHKIILKFRKGTMQCFDIYFFYLMRHFDILDWSTRNCSSARFELDVGDQFTYDNSSGTSSHLKKGQNENRLVKIGPI